MNDRQESTASRLSSQHIDLLADGLVYGFLSALFLGLHYFAGFEITVIVLLTLIFVQSGVTPS